MLINHDYKISPKTALSHTDIQERNLHNMNNSFYAILFRQRYIKRWGLMRNTYDETLEEHAAETAMLAHALASIGNEILGIPANADRAVTLALFHDATEVYTGDLPTPVKYYSDEIRESYKRIEAEAAARICTTLPDKMQNVYRSIFGTAAESDPEEKHLHDLVKAADKLSAYIKCLTEQRSGNHEFDSAAQTIYKTLSETDCPELHWFMENLLEPFTVSLDEVGL